MAAYDTIDIYALSVIRPAIEDELTVVEEGVATDSDIQNAMMDGTFFQFSARYIYSDYEKSTWSPISMIAEAYRWRWTPFGGDQDQIAVANKIKITVPMDNPHLVIRIEVAVRIGNNGVWYLFAQEDTDGVSATQDVYYYNNEVLTGLPQEHFFRPYDYVPKLAGAQELISDNRVAYGDITEGFDLPELAITITATNTAWGGGGLHLRASVSANIEDMGGGYFILNCFNNNGHVDQLLQVMTTDGIEKYLIHDYYYFDGTDWTSTYGAGDMAEDYVEFLQNSVYVSNAWNVANALHIQFGDDYLDGYVTLLGSQGSLTYTEADKALKAGTKQYFGIMYKDDYGRKSTVLTSADSVVDIDPISEIGFFEYRTALTVTATNTPPIWAKKWQFVWAGSNFSWFQQFVVRKHNQDDLSIEFDDGYTRLKINQCLNDVRDQFPHIVYENYVFTEGDRLRVVGYTDSYYYEQADPTPQIHYLFDAATDFVDMPIHKFDGTYIYIDDWGIYPNSDEFNSDFKDVVVEIYRLRAKTEDLFYYETDYVYDIVNPGEAGRSHGGAKTVYLADCFPNIVPFAFCAPTAPAVPVTSSTTTSSTTTTSTPLSLEYWQEVGCRVNVLYSPYKWAWNANSKEYNRGFPNVVNKNATEGRINSIRWGGAYISQSFINNLSQFDYADLTTLPDLHGVVYGLKQVGYTLKALQESKNTSIPIQREMYTDAAGNSQMVMTDKVLGSQRQHEEDYGTIFKQSMIQVDRNLYYYDIYSGKIIQDTPQGQEVISLRGMDSYIRAKSKALLDSGITNISVISGADHKNGVVYFTFIDSGTPANNETIAYHTWDGKWLGNFSFVPELYGGMGDNMFVSFNNGQLWKHNSDSAVRCNFYGVQYDCEIHLVSNMNPGIVKQYDSIEVLSNSKWTAINDGDIVIDPSARYPFGMQSKILASDWEEYEEVFRAAFNYDMFTDNTGVASVYDLQWAGAERKECTD